MTRTRFVALAVTGLPLPALAAPPGMLGAPARAAERAGGDLVAITIQTPRACAPSAPLAREAARSRPLPGPARDLPGYSYIDAGGCAVVALPTDRFRQLDALGWASQAAREALSSRGVSAETASRLARALAGPGARGPVPAPADRSKARRVAAGPVHIVLLPPQGAGARPNATPHEVEQCSWYVEGNPITGESEPEEVCVDIIVWF